MSLLPPIEGNEYLDRQSMINAIQQHARDNGYAMTIHRSSTKDGTVYLGCDRGGTYRSRNGICDQRRLRDTGSRQTGCQFSVREDVKDNVWTFKVRNPDHNHEPSISPIAHPVHRRLPFSLRNRIREMSSAGSAPREIVATLRQESSHSLLAKDVINVQQQQHHINLGGKLPIESLITVLCDSNWTSNYRTDDLGQITNLFFTHPRCIQLLNQFPDMLLLDCTYKTNKFKIPLLNIVGTTCLGENFYVAFAFLAKEEKEDYTWALEQLRGIFENPNQLKVTITDCERALLNGLRTVFPTSERLLCIWHIEKMY
jgi:MULE transposase domain